MLQNKTRGKEMKTIDTISETAEYDYHTSSHDIRLNPGSDLRSVITSDPLKTAIECRDCECTHTVKSTTTFLSLGTRSDLGLVPVARYKELDTIHLKAVHEFGEKVDVIEMSATKDQADEYIVRLTFAAENVAEMNIFRQIFKKLP
jgi:hypothetical protein